MSVSPVKVEYGDFQTPLELAEKICQKLSQINVNPKVIIEPTCGTGNFLKSAAVTFKQTEKILGFEINPNYVAQIAQDEQLCQDTRIQVHQNNFFDCDWNVLTQAWKENILFLGNLPWITNSKQGLINGSNLPQKSNFQGYHGLDAITGKSNFDISEWMLIKLIECLNHRSAYLAIICKTAVSRKILNYIYTQKINLTYSAIYPINTQKYFQANVDACLLFCQFDSQSENYFCDVFKSFEEREFQRIGYQNDILVRDLNTFIRLEKLYHRHPLVEKWRSGIKHDCSKVMELQLVNGIFVNGLKEIVDIETTYLYPLLKGSDVAQNRLEIINKYVLVTQKFIGESTENMRDIAPKTWQYLVNHVDYFGNRKSKIYQNQPDFSIFGVGSYTFSPFKIAISGLYKKLNFQLISPYQNQPVIFDDTVYFLSFDDLDTAQKTLQLLNSSLAMEFYSSLIFWDEKRPIKTRILNSLNLSELGCITNANAAK
jgi:hypothetical protein